MGKIKLSKTLQFLKGRLNKIAGSELEFSLVLDDGQADAGGVVRARAIVRAPEGGQRSLTCVTIGLHGQIQVGDRWEDYAQRAEAAHDVPLPGGHEYVIPIVIKIPHNAVLSEDGANWRLVAQAVVDRTIDPRAEAPVTVVGA